MANSFTFDRLFDHTETRRAGRAAAPFLQRRIETALAWTISPIRSRRTESALILRSARKRASRRMGLHASKPSS